MDGVIPTLCVKTLSLLYSRFILFYTRENNFIIFKIILFGILNVHERRNNIFLDAIRVKYLIYVHI